MFHPTSGPSLRKKTLDYDRRSSSISTTSTDCPSCNESIIHPQVSNCIEAKLSLNFGPDFEPEPPRRASSRPFQPDSDRMKHGAAPKVQTAFRQDYSSKKDDVVPENWLFFATWWLMKLRIILRMFEREDEPPQAREVNWTTSVSPQQCYADLLKSSWIFEEIVLTKDLDSFDAHQWRTVSHLARALDDDLRKYRENMQSFRDDATMENLASRLNLNLTERFEQAIEEQAMNDPASPYRWIDVDQDDRGGRHEKVIFQTFVNAQLGDKNQRDKSHDAPYTLLLWTMRGETGIFVSLCNQSGTVNLARGMDVEDLKDYDRGRPQSTLLLQFDFPNQEAEIRFINESDVHAFFKTPKQIFDEMSYKRPRPGEIAIISRPNQILHR